MRGLDRPSAEVVEACLAPRVWVWGFWFGFALRCMALLCGVFVRLHLALFPAGGPFLPSLSVNQYICTKRVADGLKDPLYLAFLLDPRPNMVAFVHKQGLLGDADNLTLGNTEAMSAAKRAIMHIAEGVPIEGKTPREVGLALCKALHTYLGVRHLFIKHACLIC
jgi:hypothetical protein